MALPILAAIAVVAIDINFVSSTGSNTILSWIGAPIAIIGGYWILYVLDKHGVFKQRR